MASPEMRDYVTDADAAGDREPLNENEVWEWNGGANILITGIRP